MKVKPTTGRAVRDPVKGILLPKEGADVDNSPFWRRRLRDGDVELATEKTARTKTGGTE